MPPSTSATAASSVTHLDPERQDKEAMGATTSWKDYFMQEIDSKEATGPLAAFCFMTGYM